MRPHFVVLALLTAGCSGNDAASRSALVERVGDAAAHAALASQQLVPDAHLCARGAQPCEVPAISGGVVAPNGDALVRVVGGRSSQVVLVRAGVDSALAFGGEGAGPGEYRAPMEIDVDAQGNVYVLDMFTRRALRFGPDAVPAAQSVVELPPAPLPTMRFVDGVLTMLSSDDPTAAGDTLPIFIYKVQESGPAERGAAMDLQLRAFGLGQFQPMGSPLQAQQQFAIGRDGSVAFSTGETGLIRLFAPSGAEVVRGGFDVRGRETTQADIDAAIAASMRGLPPAMREQALQRMGTGASRFPGLTQLLMMADGEIWAREAPEAEADSVSWLVYSAALEPKARVRMAVDDRPVGVAGGRVLLARSGDDEASTGYWWMRMR